MQMLSEDDRDIREMTAEELDAAWDLWFDLAQSTNEADPPYAHGVFAAGDGPIRGSAPSLPHGIEALGGNRGSVPGFSPRSSHSSRKISGARAGSTASSSSCGRP